MRNDCLENDPKKIWQNQPTEPSAMTVETIRKRARELHAKTRRQLLGTLSGPVAAFFLYALGTMYFPSMQPAVKALLALALGWSLAGLYFLNRGMWSAAMPADAGFSTGLEFCRREIERRRYLLRRVLLWSFGPVLLAIGTFVLALARSGSNDRGISPNALPFMTLVLVWIFGYFMVRVREQRALQNEINELNDIDRENSRI